MMDLRAPVLTCKHCHKNTAPEAITSRLLRGDVFMQYTCPACSPTGHLLLERLPMNWVSIIHLVLYHLHGSGGGSGEGRYFRWKEDICKTIEEHWDDLCPTRNPSGNWTNSVSSILSANHALFASGFTEMRQAGWWALREAGVGPRVPEGGQVRGQVALIDERVLLAGGGGEDEGVLVVDGPADTPAISPSPTTTKVPVKPQPPPPTLPPQQQQARPQLTAQQLQTLAHAHALRSLASKPQLHQQHQHQPSAPPSTLSTAADEIKRKLVERLLRVDSDLLRAALSKEATSTTATSKQNPIMYIPPSTGGTSHGSSTGVQPPKKKAKPANYIRASPHENELMELVARVTDPDDRLLRLKRKLAVRRVKRMNGIQLFDLDNWIYPYLKAATEPISLLPQAAPTLLAGLRTRLSPDAPPVDDSLIRGDASAALVAAELSDVPFLRDARLSFRAKLEGVTALPGYPWELESPYSGNKLPPYIYRETRRIPPKARLLEEIRRSGEEDPSQLSVDFSHLRREHVPQLNALLRQHFWPSIDISECLEWPDYSLVLLHRNLVIGCALCNPEGYISYLFVHPEWRNTGLASTMLYVLIARLLPEGRDVTVHVAVGNPAMMLYQKFGFKAEEFIVDFYSQRFRQQNGDGTPFISGSGDNIYFSNIN